MSFVFDTDIDHDISERSMGKIDLFHTLISDSMV